LLKLQVTTQVSFSLPKKAANEGYQQVMWTDDATHQFLEEAGTMNLWFRFGDTLVTCPTSERILDGVTRKSIIAVAEKLGIKTEISSSESNRTYRSS